MDSGVGPIRALNVKTMLKLIGGQCDEDSMSVMIDLCGSDQQPAVELCSVCRVQTHWGRSQPWQWFNGQQKCFGKWKSVCFLNRSCSKVVPSTWLQFNNHLIHSSVTICNDVFVVWCTVVCMCGPCTHHENQLLFSVKVSNVQVRSGGFFLFFIYAPHIFISLSCASWHLHATNTCVICTFAHIRPTLYHALSISQVHTAMHRECMLSTVVLFVF